MYFIQYDKETCKFYYYFEFMFLTEMQSQDFIAMFKDEANAIRFCKRMN